MTSDVLAKFMDQLLTAYATLVEGLNGVVAFTVIG